MIALVTGTPGAGKTYYTCRLIAQSVLAGKFVATNIVLADDWPERILRGHAAGLSRRRRRTLAARWRRRVIYVETIEDLARVRLGTDGFEKKLEGRGVFIFDEAGEPLDSRAWNTDKEQRKVRLKFFSQHRKLGWDGYVIAQDENMVDTQVRAMAEYTVILRNLRRLKWHGLPIWPFGNLFLAVWTWRVLSGPATIVKREWFTLSKRIAGLYDTHQVVHALGDDSDAYVWLPLDPPEAAGAPASEAPAPPATADDRTDDRPTTAERDTPVGAR